MRAFAALIIFVCVSANHGANEGYVLPVPGCVAVEVDTHTECFTHSNGAYAKHDDAQKICAAKGGRLAIIQHERVWKFLIENLLKTKTSKSIWLGYTVLPNSVQLIPNVNLENMSAYWSPSRITTSASHQYVYTHASYKWLWYIASNQGLDYLCQYNGTNDCSIADVEDSTVIVNSCSDWSKVSHNATVEIKCSPEYYLNSSQIITCKHGVWDKPRCVAGCLPPTPKDHAILISAKPHYNTGDTTFYVCEDNYYSWRDFGKTHFTLTCQNDSTWSDKDARCSLKHDYTTITININEIADDKITLKCGLPSSNITWYHNGREVVNNSASTVSPEGHLFLLPNTHQTGGTYRCQTKIGKKIQLGNRAYNILGREQCNSKLESSLVGKGILGEGEDLILDCPRDSNDRQIKWFKNEQEITDNDHQKLITGRELLIKRLTHRDGGVYKCQTTYSFNSSTCKCNVTYHLTVTASAETICGVNNRKRPDFYQPWFVILQHEDEVTPFCSGALLSDRWVVTSAFCLSSLRRKRRITGVFGQLGPLEGRKKYPILQVKVHPNYRNRRNLNHIGLIQLGGDPVEFNDDILPVCITSEDIGNVHKCENRANLKGILTGWITNTTEKEVDVNVSSTEMNLASKNECRTAGICDFAEDKFCTKSNATDDIAPESAFGNYGSPFVVPHNEKEYLMGIFTGGETDHYAYFTSIHLHYDWIKKNYYVTTFCTGKYNYPVVVFLFYKII